MGWTSTGIEYYEKKETKKELLKKYLVGCDFVYMEQKGNNVWTIEKGKAGNLFGCLYLTSVKDYEFAYKDIEISSEPFYYNCSEKYLKMISDIYKDNENVNNWIKTCRDKRLKEATKKNEIKNLKVGDRIEFENDVYNGKRIWTITAIGKKFEFDYIYHLRNWKKQNFKVIKKESV